jgi:hypothetical protein
MGDGSAAFWGWGGWNIPPSVWNSANNTSKNGFSQRFLCPLLDVEGAIASPFLQAFERQHEHREFSEERGVELAPGAR